MSSSIWATIYYIDLLENERPTVISEKLHSLQNIIMFKYGDASFYHLGKVIPFQ